MRVKVIIFIFVSFSEQLAPYSFFLLKKKYPSVFTVPLEVLSCQLIFTITWELKLSLSHNSFS